MASPPILDFDMLLTPISEDLPSGESVRYDGPYDAIEEARRADDDFDQDDWVRETKSANWREVINIATDVLAHQSKDLQIGVWLAEALIEIHGFAGLRDSLHLLWELQDRFWDTLYPELEDDDLEYRAMPLDWMNEKLFLVVQQIPLTQGANQEAFSWLRWKESRDMDNLGLRDEEAMNAELAEGKITGEQFDRAAAATPLAYLQTLYEDLTQGRTEYETLDQLCDERYGRDAPSLANIRSALRDCHALVEDLLQQRGGLPSESSEEPLPSAEHEAMEAETPALDQSAPATPAASPPMTPAHPASPSASGGQGGFTLEPQDRADALRRLQAVVEFFRRTEPHNPVSYLVERAMRWAEMPLEEWLKYVISDETALAAVHESLGLKDQEKSEVDEDSSGW